MALLHLQRGNIAPVDLTQAAIGPGMAVYTRYSQVLDAEGKLDPHQVRQAEAQLKTANGAVTARLPETYQWALVPGAEGNLLYYGDNLDVLRRHVENESVDLIYSKWISYSQRRRGSERRGKAV